MENPMNATTEKKISKQWTREGMTRLGILINRSRQLKGWSLRECCEYILAQTEFSVQVRTLALLERGALFPQWNTFCAIAESGFIQGSGKLLTIEQLMDVASGQYSYIFNPEPMDRYIRECIGDLVEDHCKKNDQTRSEFCKLYGMTVAELDGLIRGKDLDDVEGVLILVASALVNPLTRKRFRTCQEMFDYCAKRRV